MERREDPEDRKQVVREVLTEKVTLEQRPKEEDEGACRVLGASSKGPKSRDRLEKGRRPAQLPCSGTGSGADGSGGTAGALQTTLRTWI